MKKAVIRTALALAALLVMLLVWGVAVEPRLILDQRRESAPIPGLPQAWAGSEVAFFSDLQVGMWWSNEAMVERIVEQTIEEDPDVVVLGGDFVYSASPNVAQQVETVVDLLRPLLDAGLPTFAVLGNHDHHAGAAVELEIALEDMGITVLQNEAVVLPTPQNDTEGDGDLHLAGLAATRPGLTDVQTALAHVPDQASRMVFMHNPTAFPELPAGSAPLAAAGHTHCGQIALPGSPGWSYMGLTQEEKVVVDGWAPSSYGADGNRLFVSCGIGFSIVPMRINAAPQLVVFELTPG
ncbi:metallophosphoesterase [Demequina sp. SO4-13]|uniref:metallophosphoesterase n=1 Tax=Demequina sp. SO4-13 TaxID=3401027 RepID=UPI003AF7B3D0